MTEALDNRFWASKTVSKIDGEGINIEFDGEKLIIPADCMTDRFVVTVSISSGVVLDDWVITKVERPKKSVDCSEFLVTMTSEKGKDYKYAADEKITITVIPIEDALDESITFNYEVVGKKTLGVFKGTEIKRIPK